MHRLSFCLAWHFWSQLIVVLAAQGGLVVVVAREALAFVCMEVRVCLLRLSLTAQSLPRSNSALLLSSDSSAYAALTRLNLSAEFGFTSGWVERANFRYASLISANDASDSTPKVT